MGGCVRSCGRVFPKAGQLMKKIKAVFQEKSGFQWLFLAILTVGFVYEWKKGALEWE